MSTAATPTDFLLSVAFQQGRRAALDSLSPGLNPYAPGTAEALQWDQGVRSGTRAANDYANHQVKADQIEAAGGDRRDAA